MFTLQIGYQLRDYGAWKKVFDNDPAGRAASGARSVRVFRDAEDQNSVAVLSSAQQTLGKCGANSQLLCGTVRNI